MVMTAPLHIGPQPYQSPGPLENLGPCHIHTYLRQGDLSRLGPGSFLRTNTPHYNRFGICFGKPVGSGRSFSHW